jgi:hypothetical protein
MVGAMAGNLGEALPPLDIRSVRGDSTSRRALNGKITRRPGRDTQDFGRLDEPRRKRANDVGRIVNGCHPYGHYSFGRPLQRELKPPPTGVLGNSVNLDAPSATSNGYGASVQFAKEAIALPGTPDICAHGV